MRIRLPPLEPDQKSLLEQDGDTSVKWAWLDVDREKWDVVTNGYHRFYKHWRDSPTASNFLNTFPYNLSLGADENHISFLPFHPNDTSGDWILITKSYEEMFRRILRLRNEYGEMIRGVVLNGQPGTGKSTFLKFMLARLVSAHQVVLLCDSFEVHLFYCGQVYHRPIESGFNNLPAPYPYRGYPIWTLIDIDFEDRGPPFTGSNCSNIWPIQVSSPNSARWKSWQKQNDAAIFGMPQWNVEELVEGLCLQPGYVYFRGKLENHLSLLNEPTPLTTTGDEQIDTALEVLRMKNAADGAGQRHPPAENVDTALKTLVHNAIEEFGFAPRDVYDGILLPGTRARHTAALEELTTSKLGSTAETFIHSRSLNNCSHHIVAVYPHSSTPYDYICDDHWVIDFKSIRIAKEVVEKLWVAEDKHLWEACERFHNTSQGSSLAGWILEEIAHRTSLLAGGQANPRRSLRLAAAKTPASITGRPTHG